MYEEPQGLKILYGDKLPFLFKYSKFLLPTLKVAQLFIKISMSFKINLELFNIHREENLVISLARAK